LFDCVAVRSAVSLMDLRLPYVAPGCTNRFMSGLLEVVR
jgi:hypothetical protein